MPFTLSHPAAVLPFPYITGKRLPFAALVVGSLSPDLGYYFAFPLYYFRSSAHSFERSFSFCLPMGFALLVLLLALRNGLVELVPQCWRKSTEEFLSEKLTWKRLPAVAAAILIGSWTHIFWDAWTHRSGFFVRQFPLLKGEVLPGLEGYRFLQHSSTAVGLAILMVLFAKRVRSQTGASAFNPEWSKRTAFWSVTALLAVLYAAVGVQEDFDLYPTEDRQAFFLTIVMIVRACGLAALAAAAGILVWKRLTSRDKAGTPAAGPGSH